MKVKGTRIAKLSDLQMNLFVRHQLDSEHALYLGELISEGVQMKDLIEVTDRDGVMNVLVDGRHRKEGFELAGVEEVKVKVLEFDDEAELIAYAYRANTGGSKPPTAEDTEHTVALLLEHKETMKRIGELLGLPTNMARRFAKEVKSRMDRVQVQKAVHAVTDGGLNVAKAAEQYDVDPEKLKFALTGNKRKVKKGVEDLQRNLTTNYKSVSQKNASALRKMIEKFEDGDVTERQVRGIFDHLENLQKQSSRSVADWKKRFEALARPAKAAS